MDGEYTLGLNDLATNLFAILMENNSNIKKVTFNQLGEFEKILSEEAERRDLKFNFILSESEMIMFFRDCGGIFYRDDNKGINISNVITPYYLIYGRSHLPSDVLEVMISENVVNKTLDMMGVKKNRELKKDIYYYLKFLKSTMNRKKKLKNIKFCIADKF